jgi:hypothetical protein
MRANYVGETPVAAVRRDDHGCGFEIAQGDLNAAMPAGAGPRAPRTADDPHQLRERFWLMSSASWWSRTMLLNEAVDVVGVAA